MTNPIPVFRPTLPPLSQLAETIQESYASGMVTLGRVISAFEEEARRFTGAQHAVAIFTALLA